MLISDIAGFFVTMTSMNDFKQLLNNIPFDDKKTHFTNCLELTINVLFIQNIEYLKPQILTERRVVYREPYLYLLFNICYLIFY